MVKEKIAFYCGECGYESAKWFGQCPSCKVWNTAKEAVKIAGNKASQAAKVSSAKPVSIKTVETKEQARYLTGIEELDRVLGGGVVPGSLVLVGGDPGIGKSTLLLQICKTLANSGRKVLYVSGEESEIQIKLRAKRLNVDDAEITLYCESDMTSISNQLKEMKPDVAIIDSIQTMNCEECGSVIGSVSQIKEATSVLMRIAKDEGISIFIVGHVTKEGTVAGPKTLEHMVDTVLYFEGETGGAYRILRAVKNRFGSTNEIGVFEMTSLGLEEVTNPSAYMLEGRSQNEPGSVVSATMEGSRPVLVEVQALTADTSYNLPRRTSIGTDYNRLGLLLAVMEKNLRIYFGQKDVYVNIAGGMKISEPSIDLAIITALLSSCKNKPLDVMAFGEVGLMGEVRNVAMAEKRIIEAKKLGYKTCIVPKGSLKSFKAPAGVMIYEVANVRELAKL
ncbi:MAG: DNA repair protein RadA, partial [Lachnospiraceae bacterium]|nr:DNA repair protein RadA [Lachnospiraceae bacterium]